MTPRRWIAARLRRVVALGLMACAALASPTLRALHATFNTAADIPLTVPSYTATGEATFTLGFVPTPGTNLTVVKNTGLPFITGQFSNLANGATVNLTHNGTTYPFVAWYYGGDGNNDLVLLWPYTGLASWGGNSRGQLGDNSTTSRTVPVGMMQTGVLLGKTIVQVARGGSHSLALCSDGTVAAWGDNFFGQLGDGSQTQRNMPVAVNVAGGTSALAGKSVVVVAAGSAHSLALCSDGTLVAWGSNSSGRLGDNSSTQRLVPVAVNIAAGTSALAGKTVVAIAAGSSHSLALTSDGTLATWGWNVYGQLGDNSTVQRFVPVAVNMTSGISALFGKTVVALAAGGSHNMALCGDGTLVSWGWNGFGQLGDNSQTQRNAPVAVNMAAGTSALAGKTVTAIAAGSDHSLVLCSDGTLAAWGTNAYGQLGNNSTNERREVPVAVNMENGTSALAGKNVVALDAGSAYSLALCSDGKLAAWGGNGGGQLGDNSTTSRQVPVAVNLGGSSVLAGRQVSRLSVSSGASHSIAIYGETSAEIEVEVLDPAPTILTENADTVDFGTVLTAERTFRVSNTGGVPLANLSVSLTGADAASFTLLGKPLGAIAKGDTTTFVVAFTGQSPGAKSATLEIASDDDNENPFRVTLVGSKSAALEAAFAAATDTPLTASAANLAGVTVNLTLNFEPTAGTNLTVVKNTGPTFLAGQFTNLANGSTVNLHYNGTTYPFVAWYYGGEGNNDLVLLWPYTGLASWGYNGGGQLGNNSVTQSLVPVGVQQSGVLLGKTIVQVARGGSHNLALCSDGTVAAWGYNYYGQLGDNSTTDRLVPVVVNVVAGTSALFGKTVVAVAAGGLHSLALCSDGTVAAWGLNFHGGLGDNSTTSRQVPVLVNVAVGTSALAGKSVTAVAAGDSHSLALCSDGTVAAWGFNFQNQLGDNSTTDYRQVPVLVNVAGGTSALAGKMVAAVAAGYSHSLALCRDGTVVAWGANYYGELGDNSTTRRLVPVAVNVAGGTSALFGKTVVAVAASGEHSLALCSDGTLAAWGRNANGLLGDDSLTDRRVPVAVNVAVGTSTLAGKTVVAVAAGDSHSLALCSDGTVAAWGWNIYGQLGDNSQTQRRVPAALNVGAGTSVLSSKKVSQLSVSSAANHSMVIYGRMAPPAVTQSTADLALNATTLTITGTGFDATTPGNNTVVFTPAGTGSVTASTSTSLTVTSLSGLSLGALNAVVTTNGQSSGSAVQVAMVVPPPTVAQSTANLALNATTLTITGTGFDTATPSNNTVVFTPAGTGSVTASTPTSLTVTSLSGLSFGALNAVVTTNGQSSGSAVQVASVSATFNTATEVPVTAAGYTATGEATFTLGFAPTLGTNLTVVKNTGLPFITGQFSNLANGATVNLTYNGTTYPFVAWYYGGDGNNDLVLLWPYTGLAAWGLNLYGQLGDGSSTQKNVPVEVLPGALTGKTIVQVARGASHNLALCSDGTVAAWGDHSSYQTGNDNRNFFPPFEPVPVPVSTLPGLSALSGKTVVAVAAGAAHSLALCSDGTVAAWGDNMYGQLGNNTPGISSRPVVIDTSAGISALAGKTVVRISAGGSHSMALCSDGTVVAWGDNSRGQLGNSSTTQSNVPVVVNAQAGISVLAGRNVTAIQACVVSSLALCSDGSVARWGQFGNSSTSYNVVPVSVNLTQGLSALFGRSVVALASRSLGGLALCSDGRIASWDEFNTFPYLISTDESSSALFGKQVVAIASGSKHSLALCSDGTLAAWGDNNFGELGNISSATGYPPVAVNVTAGISALAGRTIMRLSEGDSSRHSSVIYAAMPPEIEVEVQGAVPTPLTDNINTVDFGSVVVAERTFQIANSGESILAGIVATLAGPDAASFTVAKQPADSIAVGETTSFAVAFTGTSPGVKTATLQIASNDYDESPFRILLTASRPAVQNVTFNTPNDVPVSAGAVNLAGTELSVILNFAPTPGTNLTVVKNTGLPFISGQFSNLANGTTVNLTHNGTNYPFVAWYYGGDGNNDLVLLWPYTGLAAWGDNHDGQLGINSKLGKLVPVAVEQRGVFLGKTVVQVAHGRSHSLALCSDGTIAAWGKNSSGQLGDNSNLERLVPVAVNAAAGISALAGKTVISVAAGESHSLAICSDGTVVAWGYNAYSQLGNNSQTSRSVPVAVNTAFGVSALAGKSVTALSAGGDHNLALCSDGRVVAWGRNGNGQLGDGSIGHRLVPVAASVLAGTSALAGKNVVAVVAGGSHSLALCGDGTVAAWGRNDYGQLGINSSGSREWPTEVNMMAGTSALAGKNVIALAAGSSHSLALCSDRTVAAWGWNSSGQLGDSSWTSRQVPVAVNVASGISALAGKEVAAIQAGNLHTLALCSDGTLAAWGWNTFGQLGNNSAVNQQVPIEVAAGTSVIAGKRLSGLSVGSTANHSIAIYGLTPPEIRISGKGIEIPHGDTTPIGADLTDFGSLTLLNAQVSHPFTIANAGDAPLNFTGSPLVTLSGSGADAFKVSLDPTDTLPVGGSTRFAVTFDPTLPGPHTATVTIQSNALNQPSFSFNIRGFGALSTALKQTITFTPPAAVHLGQSPLTLSAYANSGLPVTLSVVSTGTTAAGATIVGNALSFSGTGTVKVQAVQAGGGQYAAAPTVVKTITVRANPTSLTLLNLTQTYTGTPREISTLGGSGTVAVEYKIGTTFGSTAPTNAGSYPVRATDMKGTKTATLVIAKAPLYVTPADQRKFVGQDNPPLTLTYSGWVNGESASLVTTAPALKTTATKTSIGGVYPITASGGVVSPNYAFIYQQGSLVVDSFAASYEALLTDASNKLVGKLAITVVAANTSFTGKLECIDEKAALSLKGALLTFPITESARGNAVVSSRGILYDVNVTAQVDGSLSAIVTRNGAAYASGAGRRMLTLAVGQAVSYSGAHTAVLEPATPTSNDVPKGAGWATTAINTKGVMTFAGKLGDGTSFTTTLTPDDASDPTFRLFLQPYKTGAATRLQSHFGGAFTLEPHPSESPTLAGRRYVEAALLSWVKAGLSTDDSYRAGFGPVNTVLMLDPWLSPAAAKGIIPAVSLATRLGLTNSSFQVVHSDTGSTLNDNLPTRAGLSSTNVVSVTTPSANTTKWKTTLVPATGTFTGSFELADTTPKPRVVPFSGVLRQPATNPDTLIGDGHYLLPPLTGTEKTTGEVMFLRP